MSIPLHGERFVELTGDGRFILFRDSARADKLILDFLREEGSFQHGRNRYLLLSLEWGRHLGTVRADRAEQLLQSTKWGNLVDFRVA